MAHCDYKSSLWSYSWMVSILHARSPHWHFEFSRILFIRSGNARLRKKGALTRGHKKGLTWKLNGGVEVELGELECGEGGGVTFVGKCLPIIENASLIWRIGSVSTICGVFFEKGFHLVINISFFKINLYAYIQKAKRFVYSAFQSKMYCGKRS